MSTIKNAGLFICNQQAHLSNALKLSQAENIHIKKILFANENEILVLPTTCISEVVTNISSIIDDEEIDIVLFSSSATNHVHLAGEALKAGKSVRII